MSFEHTQETFEKLKKQFNASVDKSKKFRTPVLVKNHSYWYYEAFEKMHAQDGTNVENDRNSVLLD